MPLFLTLKNRKDSQLRTGLQPSNTQNKPPSLPFSPASRTPACPLQAQRDHPTKLPLTASQRVDWLRRTCDARPMSSEPTLSLGTVSSLGRNST